MGQMSCPISWEILQSLGKAPLYIYLRHPYASSKLKEGISLDKGGTQRFDWKGVCKRLFPKGICRVNETTSCSQAFLVGWGSRLQIPWLNMIRKF